MYTKVSSLNVHQSVHQSMTLLHESRVGSGNFRPIPFMTCLDGPSLRWVLNIFHALAPSRICCEFEFLTTAQSQEYDQSEEEKALKKQRIEEVKQNVKRNSREQTQEVRTEMPSLMSRAGADVLNTQLLLARSGLYICGEPGETPHWSIQQAASVGFDVDRRYF